MGGPTNLADLVPDAYRTEDATDWCWRLLNDDGAKVRKKRVEDGQEPSRWTAGDELGDDGVGEGCVVSCDERKEQCDEEDERRDVDARRSVEVHVALRRVRHGEV